MAGKVTKNKNFELPSLPYGEGTMSYMPDGKTIIYKKTINKKRVSVYATSAREALKKMREKEKEATAASSKKQRIENKTELLGEGMIRWLTTYRTHDLKQSSYDRLECTINNQILKYPISQLEIKSLDSDTIQKHINTLVNKELSHSTVKKAYEALNDFFNFIYLKDPYNNPMLGTIKPKKSEVIVDVKQVEFFDTDDIKKLVDVAGATYPNGKPFYKCSWGIIGLMFCGMRINEALALKWGDIDFEKNVIHVNKTASTVKNREYKNDKDKKYVTIYTTPKTKAGIRNIELPENAVIAFKHLKKMSEHTEDTDFVYATDNGTAISDRNMRRTLNSMQRRAKTEIQNSGLHVLRHTFCSLLARNGIDKVVIAEILGQEDTEMIEKIYQHVSPSEIKKAIRSISNIDLKF